MVPKRGPCARKALRVLRYQESLQDAAPLPRGPDCPWHTKASTVGAQLALRFHAQKLLQVVPPTGGHRAAPAGYLTLGPSQAGAKSGGRRGVGARSEDSRREAGEEKGKANSRTAANTIGLKSSFAVASPLRAELCLACVASGKSALVISLGASHGT